MRMLLKGAAIALAVAGTTLAATEMASAQGVVIGVSNRGDHVRTGISADFGNVAFGYRDGYWDNDHSWHNWRNSRDHDNYRSQRRDFYRSGYHHRYRDHGWMSPSRNGANFGISFNSGDVAFGYRDGYWDNDHRWHTWRNSRDHRDYRDQHGDNYRNGYHHRYRGQGWRRD